MSGMSRSERERERERERALDAEITRTRALRDSKERANASASASIRKRVMKDVPRLYSIDEIGTTRSATRSRSRSRSATRSQSVNVTDRHAAALQKLDAKYDEIIDRHVAVAAMQKLYAKYEAIAATDLLTNRKYNEIMVYIRSLTNDEDFQIFAEEMAAIRTRKITDNIDLTKAHYNDQKTANFILFVFSFILPQLIKQHIPNNIALLLINALRAYTINFAILYYRLFLDSKNPIIKHLKDGKILTKKLLNELTPPYTMPLNSVEYNLITGLPKIKKYIESILNSDGTFNNKPRLRIKFIFFYLSIFILLLYVVLRIDVEELKLMLDSINFSPSTQQPNSFPRIGQAPKIELLPSSNGGKKRPAAKRSTPKRPVLKRPVSIKLKRRA
jgi:hypothetical protein